MAKADLHLHSRYSDQAAEWLLRRFGIPDSLSAPARLYDALRAQGMDFVTLTDHNTLDGALTLAGRPGVFLSEQVTTHFPDDRAEIHVLVWGLTEAQHRDIAQARANILDLQRLLAGENLAHAVAHPLYDPGARLEAAHWEKLVLLFSHFEGINGLRHHLLSTVAREWLGALTPAKIEELANRHGLAPTHSEPWKKCLVGGSDDHGGYFPGRAWTETPPAASAEEFLAHLRERRATPHGTPGDPLTVAHGLYNTAWEFAKERVLSKAGSGKSAAPALVEKAVSRFLEGKDPTEFSLAEKAGFLAQSILDGRIFEVVKPGHLSVWRELSKYFSGPAVRAAIAEATAGMAEPERRSFAIANLFLNQLAYRFFTRFLKQLSGGNVIEAMQAVSAVVPLALSLAPYLFALRSQAPDRDRLFALGRSFADEPPAALRNEKRAWFTDTLEDINGVATTIQRLVAAGNAAGRDIRIVTSRPPLDLGPGIPVKNFPPVGEFEIPEYELQKLTFPPVLEMLDYIQREQFSELIISTPGPVGLTALLAAKMFGLRVSGIYHTDIPYYVQILTDDAFMESLSWNYMRWFYGQFDVVFANSEPYRALLAARGIAPEKIRLLPRGVATDLFQPAKRDPQFWRSRGAGEGDLIVLYVGRVSVEKQLDLFAACLRRLREEHALPVRAAVVGDGVWMPEIRRLLPDGIFTGILAGEDLARAYASADLFLFPSVTDTYGNVVVESQASGLPIIVSDQGGPRELVENGVTGVITRGLDLDSLTSAAAALLRDPARRAQLGRQARATVESRGWGGAFEKFWAMN